MNELHEKVFQVIRKNMQEPCPIGLESRLVEDLRLDSFDRLMIISGIEETFGMEVPEDQLPELRTVRDIVVLLESCYHEQIS